MYKINGTQTLTYCSIPSTLHFVLDERHDNKSITVSKWSKWTV